MGFSRVRFNNFRNIEPREIKWSPGLNLLTGKNGTGKTNILEGINIISGWGPLERGTKSASLPTWNSGSDEVRLTGQLDGEAGEIIKVKIAGRCAMKLDDMPVSATELRWKVPVLTFLPNDMAILEGSASFRRRLLDMILALIVPPYAARLHDYRRGVRQKSALLRRGQPAVAVDRALLPLAAWIWKMREEAVELLSNCFNEVSDLLPASLTLTLKRGGAGLSDAAEADFLASLAQRGEQERVMKTPLVGPHRDDILIEAGGRVAAQTQSRGFRRRTAIAMILAASCSVRRKLGKDPVMLLDEVTAELDSEGKRMLFEALLSRKTQVFAATAEQFADRPPCAVYEVERGRIEQI